MSDEGWAGLRVRAGELTRDELLERLEAAEKVCVLLGWTKTRSGTPQEKALHELWTDWLHISGVGMAARNHPKLPDDYIEGLAIKRDARVAAALSRVAE